MSFRSDALVLVTGPVGFLGRRVMRHLALSGVRVRALVRPGTRREAVSVVCTDIAGPAVELAEASFNDRRALARCIEDVDVVLHIAASTQGSAASQVANTVIGSENLFRAAIEGGVSRVVLVSSLGVIGAGQVRAGSVIDESTPMDPHPEWRDPYSFAKHRQETLGWQYQRERGLPLVVVRPGPIIGPGQPILCSRVGLSAFGLFLHLGGGGLVPLTYVDNCAAAVVQAGVVPGVEGEAFCVVDDDLPSSRALLRRYRREVARVRSVPVPYRVLRQLAKANVWYSRRTEGHLPAVFTPYKVDALWKPHRYSNAKAKGGLHWTPGVSMTRALDLTFASHRLAA